MENGATGLLLATRGGHSDAVKFLLHHRASAAFSSASGDAPLQAAARNGDASLFALLLDRCDETALRTYDGRSSPSDCSREFNDFATETRQQHSAPKMLCNHQNPLVCLVENITASSVRQTGLAAVGFGSKGGRTENDELSHLVEYLKPKVRQCANNGLEVAVALNLGRSVPHLKPLQGWQSPQGTRLRDLLIEGASIDAYGSRLRSRTWQAVLGLLGPLHKVADQSESFEAARVRRYEVLCTQFESDYKTDATVCDGTLSGNYNNKKANSESSNHTDQSRPRSQSGLCPTLRQIVVDLHRARKDFPTSRLSAVQRILYIFAALHPKVGYVQGMHDIACAIYFHFHCERRRTPSGTTGGRLRNQRDRHPSSDASHHNSAASVEPVPRFATTFAMLGVPDTVEASTFSVFNELIGRCHLMQHLFQSKEHVNEFLLTYNEVLVSSGLGVVLPSLRIEFHCFVRTCG